MRVTLCNSQDRLGYAAVTNSSEISYLKTVFFTPTICLLEAGRAICSTQATQGFRLMKAPLSGAVPFSNSLSGEDTAVGSTRWLLYALV